MPSPPPIWAAIVRVSSVGGRDASQFHADQEQVEAIEAYAARHGARVVYMEPELSVSGGLPIAKRPSLKRAIEGVEAGEFDGIVVAYLSRLTRSRSGLEIWDRVEAVGGHIYAAAENIDTSTANGRFVRDVLLADAVNEREGSGERHAERRRVTVELGVWRCRQLPRGYAFEGPPDVHDGKFKGLSRKLVPGPDAHEVREAFLERADGASMAVLAERLKMTRSGVRHMLRNRVYLGELRDGEYANLESHEPLVSLGEFEAAQSAGEHANPRPPRSNSFVGPALLAGVATCAGCGHKMTRRRSREPIYGCKKWHSGGKCPAPAAVFIRLLDGHVETIVKAHLGQLIFERRDDRKRLNVAENQLEQAEAELAALVRSVTAADLDERDFASELQVRKQARDQAAVNLRAEASRQTDLPRLLRAVDMWDELDVVEQNTILRSLLSAVLVEAAGKVGQRVALPDRVRILTPEANVSIPKTMGGNQGAGIRPIPLPLVDEPGVLT